MSTGASAAAAGEGFPEWTSAQLQEHHNQHVDRDLADARHDNNVRVETAGTMLMTGNRPWVLEIPVERVTRSLGALRNELNTRLWCRVKDHPRCNDLITCFTVGEQRDQIPDGLGLSAGLLVGIRYGWIDEDDAEQWDPDPSPGTGRTLPLLARASLRRRLCAAFVRTPPSARRTRPC
eukprot:6126450-Prymnesium_polylepis.1